MQAAQKAGAQSAAWASTVSAIVGGKAGGKAPTAIGNGTSPDKVDQALKAAEDYLTKFKL